MSESVHEWVSRLVSERVSGQERGGERKRKGVGVISLPAKHAL